MKITALRLGLTMTLVASITAATVDANATPVVSAADPLPTVELLRDVEVDTPDSSPGEFTLLGDHMYFAATTPVSGQELWRRHLTTGVTEQIKDIEPGPDGAQIKGLIVHAGALYFIATTDAFGAEVWTSDGTEAGTTRVTDINPLTASAEPGGLVPFQGDLYFAASDGVNGRRLWRFDGSSAERIIDLADPVGTFPTDLVVVENGGFSALFFRANDASGFSSLQSYDGTTVTTHDVVAADADDDIDQLVAHGADLYIASDAATDPGLYWAETTGAGVTTIAHVGSITDPISSLAVADSYLYVVVGNAGDRDLLVYADGVTDPPTELLSGEQNVSLGAPDGTSMYLGVHSSLTGTQPWYTDGTLGGTVLLGILRPGSFGSIPHSWSVDTASGLALFIATDGISYRPYVTDGTPAGTTVLAPEGFSANHVGLAGPSRWWFGGDDGGPASTELWSTDGTEAGTEMLADISNTTNGSSPFSFTEFRDDIVFGANGGPYRVSPDGANLVALLPDGTDVGIDSFTPIVPVGDDLLFQGCSAALGCELYSSGGESGDATLIDDIAPGPDDLDWLELFPAGDHVFFRWQIDSATYPLWVTDGTEAGTIELSTLPDSGPAAALGNDLLFSNDGPDGEELWLSDGTVAGTDQLLDLRAGPLGSDPRHLTAEPGDDVAYFQAEPDGDPVLFRTDGTSGGTVALPTTFDLDALDDLVVVDGVVLATLDDDGDGYELAYSTDRGESWTVLSATGLAELQDAVVLDSGRILVRMYDDDAGLTVLTVIDGAGSDVLGLDAEESEPEELVAIDGHAYVVTVGTIGDVKRLWRTDGTSPGSELLYVPTSTSPPGSLEHLAVIDRRLVFRGESIAHGDEPFIADLAVAPSAPTGVTAVAGDANAAVSWNVPAEDGGREVETYTVTAAPGGATCTSSVATTCTLTGLTNGTAYTFTVVASHVSGESPPSAPSNAVTPAGSPVDDPDPDPDPDSDPDVISLTPARVLETRPGEQTIDGIAEGAGRVEGLTEVRLPIAGRGGVDSDAVAVVVNVTAINPANRGFLTIHPCGERPLASSLNYTSAGVVVGNEVVARLSATGEICLYTSAETHLTADVVGFVPAGSPVVSIEPARFFDSRAGESTFDGSGAPGAALIAGAEVEVDIAGRGSIPSDAAGVVMNVTAINPDGRGFLTVYPCGDRPLASSLNYAAAGVVAGNEVVAKLSSAGSVCAFTSTGTNLTVDVVGYVPTTAGMTSLEPARFFESRVGQDTLDGAGAPGERVGADSEVDVQVTGRGDVPADASAVVMNVTAINPDGRGYLTIHPCGDRPLASSLNVGAAGVVAGNEVIAKLSSTGSVCVYASTGTDLTIDVTGYVPA